MRQRIRNIIHITFHSKCNNAEDNDDLDIRLFTNMVVCIEQKGNKFMERFIPVITGPKSAYIDIPYETAMLLTTERAKVQIEYTDENGYPNATDSQYEDVKELIDKEGYNP